MAKRKKKEEAPVVSPSSAASEKQQRLQAILNNLNKKKPVIRKASEVPLLLPGETPLSTGSLLFDMQVSYGGYYPGRIYTLFGEESSGKTSIALMGIASAQREGKTAVFVDFEHAFSAEHAAKLGVDTDALLVCQPEDAEEGFELMNMMLEAQVADFIVVDSVSAIITRGDKKRTVEQGAQVGSRAKFMSEQLPRLVELTEKSRAIMVWINQIRFKVGVMFGNPETVSGGNALKFYASGRFRIRIKGWIKDGDNVIGQEIKVHSEKLKIGAPRRSCIIPYLYSSGADVVSEITSLIPEYPEIGIEKNGGWYTCNEKKFQGEDNLKELLRDDPQRQEALRQRLAICIKARNENTQVPIDEFPEFNFP